jgi:hypothetical protein
MRGISSVISVISSFIATDCRIEERDVVVANPGRTLITSSTERERLRELGRAGIELPKLVAVLTLLSNERGPFTYKLSSALIDPAGAVVGPMNTLEFVWPDGKAVDRISIRLTGKIDFFECGGIFMLRFLLDGAPLCEVPLPILWDDQLTDLFTED